jgi:hypothetical protein
VPWYHIAENGIYAGTVGIRQYGHELGKLESAFGPKTGCRIKCFIRHQYCSTKFSNELVLNSTIIDSTKFSTYPLAKLYDIRVSFESLIWSG